MFALFAALSAPAPAHHHPPPPPNPQLDLPADAAVKPNETRTVVFAGGCFWCTEGALRQFRGITSVISGYAGDCKTSANYETVSSVATNHAEAIQITYDPAVITYSRSEERR